ncbi:MAG: FKBP-type peptidyl-prolyl cis-trans isomerase [Bacteroidaceae bacterium]|nr:FKBP-type peptidyl-prolyl cis-trans isomerase [Bacteroidaceae bacterium]MDO5481603.1 FKBP-type peptidyl-prolyl cis-trans isomerase [Bacteroidaceae bacterium]
MKKISMMAAAVAMTAMTMVSCDGGTNASLKDGVDTLAYNLGVAQADGLKQYMTMQLGVDSAYMDEFIKGVKEGAVNEVDAKKSAYMKGLEVGGQVQQMAKGLTQEVFAEDSTQSVNVKSLLSGLVAGLKGTAGMTADEAYEKFNSQLEPIREANLEKQYGENKAAGEKYLEENKAKEGVTVTESGLQYKVLVAGDGALPTDTSTVQVNYEGKLIDGTVFDSSYERNQPFAVDMAQPRVIEGWVEALKLMPAGSKWEITIPQELGYGSQNMGQIKPFSTLIFTVEVLK